MSSKFHPYTRPPDQQSSSSSSPSVIRGTPTARGTLVTSRIPSASSRSALGTEGNRSASVANPITTPRTNENGQRLLSGTGTVARRGPVLQNRSTALQSRSLVAYSTVDGQSELQLNTIADSILEGDVSALRDANRSLRRELSELKATLNRKVSDLEGEKARLTKEVLEMRAKTETLSDDKRFLFERQLSLSKKIEQDEAGGAKAKIDVDSATRQLRAANADLSERLALLESQHTVLKRNYESSVAKTQSQTEAAQRQRALDAERVKNAEEAAKKAAEEREVWRARWTETERKLSDATSRNAMGETQRLRQELDAAHAEIARLRSQPAPSAPPPTTMNAALLHEQNLSLARRAASADVLRARVATLERQLDEARAEREGWAGMLDDETVALPVGAETPRKVARALAEAQARARAMEKRCAAVTEDAKIKELRAGELEARCASLEGDISEARAALSREEKRRMREERARSLAEREVGLYRGEIKSYDQEDTMDRPPPDERLVSRNLELEKLLDAYRKRQEELEKELSKAEGEAMKPKDSLSLQRLDEGRKLSELEDALSAARTENEVLKREISSLERQMELTSRWRGSGELTAPTTTTLSSMEIDMSLDPSVSPLINDINVFKTENATLKTEVSRLTEQLERAEVEIARGGHNPNTTKVLTLDASPAAVEFEARKAVLDALRAENEALLGRLNDFSRGATVAFGGNNQQLVPVASVDRLKLELKRLDEEKTSLSTRIDRLKTVFTHQAAIMRETVYALFGWRVELLEAGRCRIKSPLCEGTMTFVPTDDSKGLTLAGKVDGYEQGEEEYVGRCGSVAGFLAWVILVGIHKQYGGIVPGS
ncbi:hypothetical protein M427DRAFT_42421 [Gonapodya prolifera JEL478]|uniref:Spindle assembly checkpoint component MAD1 n=1 Tax=Gonapodya prolifera (strain JEL478) TaxID=1344416 RepID=A0A139ANK2_GONPJ|nr:hypothetical protein M427DRAFT_42421 [Gonapodya prolifera JEL478]|eukprot:KXS18312.1 hypothetical protein M427DRAFT_42421 [Gonapodya prolifera JEL478]